MWRWLSGRTLNKKNLHSTANLNCLFFSLFAYLWKNCSSQFFSDWKLAESVFCSEELSCPPFGWGTKVYVQNQSGPSNGILHRFCLTGVSALTSQDYNPSSVVYVSKPVRAIWWYLLSEFCALLCCSLSQYKISIKSLTLSFMEGKFKFNVLWGLFIKPVFPSDTFTRNQKLSKSDFQSQFPFSKMISISILPNIYVQF